MNRVQPGRPRAGLLEPLIGLAGRFPERALRSLLSDHPTVEADQFTHRIQSPVGEVSPNRSQEEPNQLFWFEVDMKEVSFRRHAQAGGSIPKLDCSEEQDEPGLGPDESKEESCPNT